MIVNGIETRHVLYLLLATPEGTVRTLRITESVRAVNVCG
jgi:hypothetical protein